MEDKQNNLNPEGIIISEKWKKIRALNSLLKMYESLDSKFPNDEDLKIKVNKLRQSLYELMNLSSS